MTNSGKIIYLDLGMGAAGDMLGAALYELLPDREAFLKKLNEAGIKDVVYAPSLIQKMGITGTKMHVLIHGMEECVPDDESHHEHDHHEHHHEHDHHEHHHEHDHYDHHDNHEHHHDHQHEHDHHDHGAHPHHHSSMQDITEIIAGLNIRQEVKDHILSVYSILADAESRVHGEPVNKIHFHEVGDKDAIADITAVCMLIDELKPAKIIASQVNTGSGTVKCAHGILPVPAPATALILEGIPNYGSEIKGELCTPTGAALIRHFVQEFGPKPVMTDAAIGYGMGTKDFERLNCVRAFFGENNNKTDRIVELSCNIDDMTGEDIGYAMSRLMEEGARDVFVIPVYMKKSRPGSLLNVICAENEKEKFVRLIFRLTSTIGIREKICERYVLDRTETVSETEYGPVRTKFSTGYGVSKEKPEYEDIARAAALENTSPEEIRKRLLK